MNAHRFSFVSTALATTLACSTAAWAAVPGVESVGRPAVIKCGTSATGAVINAQHADKIIFKLSGNLPAVDPAQQAALNAIPRNTELDIKVLDNPKAVADLKAKILSFLNAIDNPDTRPFVTILSVQYAMVCPHP